MARTRVRTSRVLIVLLASVLLAGLVVVWRSPRKSADAGTTPVTLFKSPGSAKQDDATTQPTGVTLASPAAMPLMAAVALTPTSGSPTDAKIANPSPAASPITLASPATPASPKTATVVASPTIAANIVSPASATPAAGPSATTPLATVGTPALPTPSKPANVVVAIATAPQATASTPTGDVFATSKSQQDSGDLIAARKTLNDALLAGSLSADQIAQAKTAIGTLNDQIIFGAHKFSDDPYAETYVVHSGDRATKIAAHHEITSDLLLQMNGLTDARKMRVDQKLKLINGPFNAVVNKSAYTIDLYIGPPGQNGSMFVKEFRVALGKDNSTPPGTWMVKPDGKMKNPKFWGTNGLPPVESGDPKNPLGAYWIALEGTEGQAVDKTGYGIHGTCDPDSIGKQASLGCIRLKNEDVAVVYELLVDGKSTVTVKP